MDDMRARAEAELAAAELEAAGASASPVVGQHTESLQKRSGSKRAKPGDDDGLGKGGR